MEEGAGPKLTLGASVSLLGDGVFGLEATVAHTPRFFEGNDPLGLVLTSRVTTVSGSAIVTAPLALTRESLRPYLVGGIGLMQARSKHAADLFPVDENLPAVHIGVGAIGFCDRASGPALRCPACQGSQRSGRPTRAHGRLTPKLLARQRGRDSTVLSKISKMLMRGTSTRRTALAHRPASVFVR